MPVCSGLSALKRDGLNPAPCSGKAVFRFSSMIPLRGAGFRKNFLPFRPGPSDDPAKEASRQKIPSEKSFHGMGRNTKGPRDERVP